MSRLAEIITRALPNPRLATDIAVNAARAGSSAWPMVVLLGLSTLLAELISRHIIRPALGNVLEPLPSEIAWLDNSFAIMAIIITYYTMVLLFSRWFWRKVASASASEAQIEGAIMVGLAASIVLLFPQYFLMEYFDDGSVAMQVITWVAPLVVLMAMSAIYFSHALEISLSRAFWLNTLQGLICTFVFITCGLVLLLLWFVALGLSTDRLFEASAVTQ